MCFEIFFLQFTITKVISGLKNRYMELGQTCLENLWVYLLDSNNSFLCNQNWHNSPSSSVLSTRIVCEMACKDHCHQR